MEYLSYNKKQLIDLAREAGLIDIEEAKVDLLKKYLEVKARLDYDKAYIETIQSEVVKEIEKYPEKTFDLHGRKISTMESGTNYDFINTGDIEFCLAEEDFLRTKKRFDDRKTFLKNLKGAITLLDESSGEVYRVTAPVKTSYTVPKIS